MEKIVFENLPSTNTPINANNLNQLQTNVENAINGVVESGSNYIKFESGDMICFDNVSLTGITFNKADGAVIAQTASGVNFGNFPQAFIEIPKLLIDCYSSPYMKPLDLYGRSASAVGKAYLWTWNALENVNATFTYLAIGKWK